MGLKIWSTLHSSHLLRKLFKKAEVWIRVLHGRAERHYSYICRAGPCSGFDEKYSNWAGPGRASPKYFRISNYCYHPSNKISFFDQSTTNRRPQQPQIACRLADKYTKQRLDQVDWLRLKPLDWIKYSRYSLKTGLSDRLF